MCTRTDCSQKRKQIFEVGKDILDKTIECKKDKACLCDSKIMCEVEDYIPDEIIFVYCDSYRRKNCKYHLSFGGADLCGCPTRIEIFRKYEE